MNYIKKLYGIRYNNTNERDFIPLELTYDNFLKWLDDEYQLELAQPRTMIQYKQDDYLSQTYYQLTRKINQNHRPVLTRLIETYIGLYNIDVSTPGNYQRLLEWDSSGKYSNDKKYEIDSYKAYQLKFDNKYLKKYTGAKSLSDIDNFTLNLKTRCYNRNTDLDKWVYDVVMINKEVSNQEAIVYHIRSQARLLIDLYIELDYMIQDEDNDYITEDMFNYQGFNPIYTYAQAPQKKKLDAFYNDSKKFQYILSSMTNSELKTLLDPFTIEYVLKPFFKHPLLGIELGMDVYNPKSMTPKTRKSVMKKRAGKTTYEHQTKIYTKDRYVRTAERKLALSYGYEDGEDLADGRTLFLLGFRISKLSPIYWNTDKRKKVTLAMFNKYLGFKDAYANKNNLLIALDRINDIEYEINNVNVKITQLNKELKAINENEELKNKEKMDLAYDKRNAIEEQELLIEYLEEKLESSKTIIEVYESVKEEIIANFEQIMSDSNARNVNGAITALKAMESGSYNDTVEEKSNTTFNIIIDRDALST